MAAAALMTQLTAAQPAQPVIWRVDNLDHIGGHVVTLVGAPAVVHDEHGTSVEVNGTSDGLLLDTNPLAGLERFTIEVIFAPAPDGLEEQRFLHIEEPTTGNRVLLETRRIGAIWSLDTFLRSPEPGLTLLDRQVTHPSAEWHAVALTYDGRTMTHFVNGRREASGEVPFRALGQGRTSIGVRQNRVSWFKGRIKLIRISPVALDADRLLARTAR